MNDLPSGNGRIARGLRRLSEMMERQRVMSAPGTLVTTTPRGQFVRATAGSGKARGTGGTVAVVVFL